MTQKNIVFQAHVKKTKPKQPVETSWSVFTDDYQSVKLSFVISDMFPTQLEGAIPSLILTMEDGSVVQINHEKIELKENVFSYTLSETEGKHIGVVETQLRFTINNRQLTTDRFTFQILESLFDVKIPSAFVLDDIQNILVEVTHHINSVFEDEPKRAEVFADFMNQLDVAEKQRQQLFEHAQSLRAITFRQLEDDVNSVKDTYDELVDTGILESNISVKLTELENNYAPRLSTLEQNDVSLTAQLQQNAKFEGQADFVDIVNSKTYYEKMRVKKSNYPAGAIEVFLDNGKEHISHLFTKNANDDFWMYNTAFGGDLTTKPLYKTSTSEKTGTWTNPDGSGNSYTTNIGATFTASVKGERIVLNHYTTSAGGAFDIVIDGDVENPVRVSVYNPTNLFKQTLLAENLDPNQTHTVVGTFIGADPNNAPTGTARGWIRDGDIGDYSHTLTGGVASNGNYTNNTMLLGYASNKEFAFSIEKNGETQWFPEHNGVGTAFAVTPIKFLLDGRVLDINEMVVDELHEGAVFEIVQDLVCRFPTVEGDMALMSITHTITKDGVVSVTGTFEVLQEMLIKDGYSMMFPLVENTMRELLTGIGNSKINTADSSIHVFSEEKDKTYSFASIDSRNPDYISAVTFDYPYKTLRVGLDGRGADDNFFTLWQRTNYPKVYGKAYTNYNAPVGERYTFSGRFTSGKVSNIYNLIK